MTEKVMGWSEYVNTSPVSSSICCRGRDGFSLLNSSGSGSSCSRVEMFFGRSIKMLVGFSTAGSGSPPCFDMLSLVGVLVVVFESNSESLLNQQQTRRDGRGCCGSVGQGEKMMQFHSWTSRQMWLATKKPQKPLGHQYIPYRTNVREYWTYRKALRTPIVATVANCKLRRYKVETHSQETQNWWYKELYYISWRKIFLLSW